jgi:hypothetical protein
MKVLEFILRVLVLCLYLLFVPALLVVLVMGLFFNLSVAVFIGSSSDELSEKIKDFFDCAVSVLSQCKVILNL